MILAQNWPKTAKSSWQCPFKEKCKKELERLVDRGIISAPTEWISFTVVVMKPNEKAKMYK